MYCDDCSKWASFRFNRDPVLVFMIVASGITMCALSKPRNNETYYDDRNFDVIGPSNENRYIYIYIHTNSRGFSVTLCFSFLYDITDKTGIDKIDTRFAIIIATRIRFNFKPNYTILLTPSCLFIFVLSSIDNLWDWQTFEKNYFTRIFVNDQTLTTFSHLWLQSNFRRTILSSLRCNEILTIL